MKHKVFVIDVIEGRAYTTEIGKYMDIYPLIHSDIFDVVERKLEQEYFSFYVDDIGLLRSNPIPAVMDKDMNINLFGSVVVSRTDEHGETVSLSKEDIALIKSHLITGIEFEPDLHFHPVLVDVEY